MRVAGLRVSAPYYRLLVEVVERAGFPATARTLAVAAEMNATEVALTIEDCEAILDALSKERPAGLERLHTVLVEDHNRWRRQGLVE